MNQTRKPDQIIVVDDASTDKTFSILKTFGKKIKLVQMPQKGGNKSFVQQYGMRFITGDVFITVDADTILDKEFVAQVEKAFKNSHVAAFAGYVKSMKHNWLTACRELDYVIGQNIHKQAQGHLNYIYVIPGCAGAFRTNLFKRNISFDHDTLTEDLDFTYKLHKLGKKIVFERNAIVYTQDPSTLYSYVNQIRRWYSGGWQNLLKHKDLPFDRPQTALELSLVYLEGLLFASSLFLMPFINVHLYVTLFAVYFSTVVLFTLYAVRRSQRWDLLQAIVFMPFLIYVQAFIFLEQFVKEIVLRKKNLVWFHPERRAIA
ncbi:hypothetical protein A2801_00710 [Candidatus Woesebacteria bacterium RIFCSPHIGHO2_01_FULL_41_10]|uniref:Glycosyltransferase 2-like domain-containing protein n=1 Tax=Candidatus Woesebacteria bacterium RIFCSPHIGHO2_01_FULL_41_10 TaxID=1802500 RepID=A0A1F7YMZ1_9BACT|nr:MAG: hypothetical protein A2801_00710 [Candidatus Woesebacteria bacterium RIFCSPHIGHO2_01_FULL_41_10]